MSYICRVHTVTSESSAGDISYPLNKPGYVSVEPSNITQRSTSGNDDDISNPGSQYGSVINTHSSEESDRDDNSLVFSTEENGMSYDYYMSVVIVY